MLTPTMIYSKHLSGIGSVVEGGVSLNYIIVDAEEVDEKVSEGWIVNLQEALQENNLVQEEPVEELEEVTEEIAEEGATLDDVVSQTQVRKYIKKVK